jgi:predicted metal-dependent HD superfamily phosphohydrolase
MITRRSLERGCGRAQPQHVEMIVRYGNFQHRSDYDLRWLVCDTPVTRPRSEEPGAEILRRFLDRQRIYATDHFATKYELQARRNLERSIQLLTNK